MIEKPLFSPLAPWPALCAPLRPSRPRIVELYQWARPAQRGCGKIVQGLARTLGNATREKIACVAFLRSQSPCQVPQSHPNQEKNCEGKKRGARARVAARPSEGALSARGARYGCAQAGGAARACRARKLGLGRARRKGELTSAACGSPLQALSPPPRHRQRCTAVAACGEGGTLGRCSSPTGAPRAGSPPAPRGQASEGLGGAPAGLCGQ